MTTADLPRAVTIAVLAVVAAAAGGFAGMQLGEALGYAVARLIDRDIAELKDMLIWSLIAGMAIGAAAGIWIVLALAPSPRWLRRSALAVSAIAAVGGAAIIAAAYDWPKSSGHPVVQYELRLPQGVVLPPKNNIRLDQWQGKYGHGIYIDRTGITDGRAEIAGSFVVGRDSTGGRRMSNRAGAFRMPAMRRCKRPTVPGSASSFCRRRAPTPCRCPRATTTSAIGCAATCDPSRVAAPDAGFRYRQPVNRIAARKL
jgi:hypothetical protein